MSNTASRPSRRASRTTICPARTNSPGSAPIAVTTPGASAVEHGEAERSPRRCEASPRRRRPPPARRDRACSAASKSACETTSRSSSCGGARRRSAPARDALPRPPDRRAPSAARSPDPAVRAWRCTWPALTVSPTVDRPRRQPAGDAEAERRLVLGLDAPGERAAGLLRHGFDDDDAHAARRRASTAGSLPHATSASTSGKRQRGPVRRRGSCGAPAAAAGKAITSRRDRRRAAPRPPSRRAPRRDRTETAASAQARPVTETAPEASIMPQPPCGRMRKAQAALRDALRDQHDGDDQRQRRRALHRIEDRSGCRPPLQRRPSGAPRRSHATRGAAKACQTVSRPATRSTAPRMVRGGVVRIVRQQHGRVPRSRPGQARARDSRSTASPARSVRIALTLRSARSAARRTSRRRRTRSSAAGRASSSRRTRSRRGPSP